MGLKDPADPTNLAVRDFFLYIATVNSANIQCNQTYINTRSGRRRRRDERAYLDTKVLHRNARETNTESAFPTDVSLETLSEAYIHLVCVVERLASDGEYKLKVNARVFEPTLVTNSPEDIWKFSVYIIGIVDDTHATQMEGHLSDSSQTVVTLVPSRVFGTAELVTLWWHIIVAVGIFIVFSVPLLFLLYFAGFFQKSKTQKARKEFDRKLRDCYVDGNTTPEG